MLFRSKSNLENYVPYNEWKKCIDVESNKIDSNIAKRVMQDMQKNHEVINSKYSKSGGWLSKNTEIDFSTSARFISSMQKSSSDKYLDSYKQMQNSLSMQTDVVATKTLNDTQQNLSRVEKEIC